jgi:hypothetical protein
MGIEALSENRVALICEIIKIPLTSRNNEDMVK